MIVKFIGNMDEIKKAVKKAKLPKEFTLSDCAIIRDVPKFIEGHLTMLDTDRLQRRHPPYYERLKQLFDTLGIEIKIEQTKK